MAKKIIFGSVIIVLAATAALLFYSKKSEVSLIPPEENRFHKNVLLSGLDEPMELAVLPDGNILFIERKGALKLFRHEQDQVNVLATLNVFHDLEDGLLGLTLDPDFKRNNFLYLFYSPAGEKPVQRVSRFMLSGSTFDPATEKILLEIPTQRKECCHSAGSLTFGPDNTLYIAVGDNTNPHNPGYYNSIDERPGREYWDAQRTAANTNDYRGKILRIRPEADGTYSIPDGNLFPKDGSGGKPEIFAMGCRNPYRITVDYKTNFLYWGDVGQNTENNPARGPISYDEFHQAKGPGFFGWPYFAGDNQPYADFDFATGEIGPFFNPQHPVNDSPNNTGRRDLPPAQPAFIWYSYDSSARFEHLGTGGKSPIIGPIYYSDLYQTRSAWTKVSRKFPEYYNGKLFIAEWMRDWINVVTMDEDGNLTDIEEFMPATKFDHPIDLEFGPDGALYVLEYGTFWFAQNKDAKLVRIDYIEGNRAPVARIVANKTAGAVPLAVNFSAAESYDNDKEDELNFSWTIDGRTGTETSGPIIRHTFAKPGIYKVTLKAVDPQGEFATAEMVIQAGNEIPEIELEAQGNKTFYRPGKRFHYAVKVTDKEDGSLGTTISADSVRVTLHYVKNSAGLSAAIQNKDMVQTQFYGGLELINQSDCKACHHRTETSVGPAYEKIAERYQKDNAEAISMLPEKIIKGGAGNWGETAMSAHPQLSKEEATEMVKYILSLSKGSQAKNRLPSSGFFVPEKDSTGNYVLQIVYRDRGGEGIGPQTAKHNFLIRNPKLRAVDCDDNKDVSKFNDEVVKFTRSGAYISFNNIDLSHLKTITYALSAAVAGTIELHLDSVSGPALNVAKFNPTKQGASTDATEKGSVTETLEAMLQPVSGVHDIYFVYKDAGKTNADAGNTLDLWYILFD